MVGLAVTREIWLQQYLPPPLINAASYQALVQQLRAAILVILADTPKASRRKQLPAIATISMGHNKVCWIRQSNGSEVGFNDVEK